MSNTVVNREVIFIYNLHRLLALFVILFQTARTLYFLWVRGGYSKTGAYSWRRGRTRKWNCQHSTPVSGMVMVMVGYLPIHREKTPIRSVGIGRGKWVDVEKF